MTKEFNLINYNLKIIENPDATTSVIELQPKQWAIVVAALSMYFDAKELVTLYSVDEKVKQLIEKDDKQWR